MVARQLTCGCRCSCATSGGRASQLGQGVPDACHVPHNAACTITVHDCFAVHASGRSTVQHCRKLISGTNRSAYVLRCSPRALETHRSGHRTQGDIKARSQSSTRTPTRTGIQLLSVAAGAASASKGHGNGGGGRGLNGRWSVRAHGRHGRKQANLHSKQRSRGSVREEGVAGMRTDHARMPSSQATCAHKTLHRQYRESGLPSTQRLRHPTHPRISRHKMARWLFTHAHNRKELALTMDAVMLSLLFKLRQSSSRLLHTSVSATVVGDAAPWDIRTTA